MTGREPMAEPLLAHDERTSGWSDTVERLGNATYWLATVRQDGRPHLVPVLAVWVDDAVYFCAGAGTSKARNLADDAHCAIAASGDGVDLVAEGTASQVTDEPTLRRVADAYATVYDWHVTVRRGAFHDVEGAPTAGPPPYDVYTVTPATAFGFGTDESYTATRWRFQT